MIYDGMVVKSKLEPYLGYSRGRDDNELAWWIFEILDLLRPASYVGSHDCHDDDKIQPPTSVLWRSPRRHRQEAFTARV